MKAVPKKELIAILVRAEEEILFKEQIIDFFDNLGDDYYCVDGNYLSEEQWDWLIDNFKELNEVPSVQPEQKTGRWIDYCGDLHCSACGFRNSDHYCLGEGIACPNCGAFMPDGLKNVLG